MMTANEITLAERKAQLRALLIVETRPARRQKLEKMLAKIEKAEAKGLGPGTIVMLLSLIWQLLQVLFPKPKP